MSLSSTPVPLSLLVKVFSSWRRDEDASEGNMEAREREVRRRKGKRLGTTKQEVRQRGGTVNDR